MSPKKMRHVAQLIKGKPVEEALNILNFTPKIAAHHLAKTVKAAAANAISSVGTAKIKAEDLSITNVMVDGGPIAPRVRFQSMGRAHRIRKRFCHLTVEVEGEPEVEETKSKSTRRQKAKAEKPEAEEKKSKPGTKKSTTKAKKAKDESAKEKPQAKDAKIDEKPEAGAQAEPVDKKSGDAEENKKDE